MSNDAKDAFEKASLGTENKAYNLIAELDPEYFEKLKGLYVDATFPKGLIGPEIGRVHESSLKLPAAIHIVEAFRVLFR